VNIVEAIKSGKRFKRSTETTYRDSQQYHYKSDPAFYLLHIEDILANDWEIEPESVTITREQFNAAWDTASLMIGIKRHRDVLAKELGL